MLELSPCIARLRLRGGEIETSCCRLNSPRARLVTPRSGRHTILVGVSPSSDAQGLWAGFGPGVGKERGEQEDRGNRELGISPASNHRRTLLLACGGLTSLPRARLTPPSFSSLLAPFISHPALPCSGEPEPLVLERGHRRHFCGSQDKGQAHVFKTRRTERAGTPRWRVENWRELWRASPI